MRLYHLIFALALPLSAGACTSSEPEPPLAQAGQMAARWVGDWSSPSCGSRWFERRISLKDDGRFTAEDRIAPCPFGMQCMWGGVVYWSGRWSAEGNQAILHEESAGPLPGPEEAPRPDVLEWDAESGAPAEMSSEGALCPYWEIHTGPTLPA
jgi:hypothetical protein